VYRVLEALSLNATLIFTLIIIIIIIIIIIHLSEVLCLQADDITDGMCPLPAVYRRMFKRQTVIFAEHFGANRMILYGERLQNDGALNFVQIFDHSLIQLDILLNI